MADVTQAVGKLVVAVTTAQGTIPLPGALVTVSVSYTHLTLPTICSV